VATYLDSSALVKLVVAERESGALRRFLARDPLRVASSLARLEVRRAVRSHGLLAVDRAGHVLARVRLLRIDDALLDAAAALDPLVMRSLDAIHLASALALGTDLACVVTYDKRMIDAAHVLGLAVRAPGAPRVRVPRPTRKSRGRLTILC
jgi:predicted nucleic acid-binding protein